MTPFIVGSILLLILIIDLFIFRTVTDRPLGLAPSDLSSGPKINTSSLAEPVALAKITPGEPYILVPKMMFQPVQNNSDGGVSVIGFGRAGSSLYLQIRLHESLDLSLKKGWGKAIQLIDSQGRSYLYDSYSLPSGVHLYDPLVDLPDDMRGNQTICNDGFKDLYLQFPDFPSEANPVQLRVIEAFQGDSPANPGIIYHDISFKPVGAAKEKEAIIALASLERPLNSSEPISLSNSELKILLGNFWLDESLFPCLSFTTDGTSTEAYLKDCVLIDSSGFNYNLLQLEEAIPINTGGEQPAEIRLMFERVPDTADIKQIWFKFSIGGKNFELTIDI
ncbi:MAG: hypothetical protein GX262_06660 [Clostridia bacterium]|nr:hypothetical protein [Clostridia bacterium]